MRTLLAAALAINDKFMSVDQPIVPMALQRVFIGAPESKLFRTVCNEVQGLYVGTGVRRNSMNRSELRTEHMLGRTVFFQRAPDIVDPGVAAMIDLGAEAYHLDIFAKASPVVLAVALVHSGGIV